jgi:hypothetical protein
MPEQHDSDVPSNDLDEPSSEVFVADADDFEEISDDSSRRPKWIGPFSVLSIIFSIFGILGGLLGVVGIPLSPTLLDSAQIPGGVPELATHINGPFLTLAIIGLLWALFLLASAIALRHRQPRARKLFLIYALGGVMLAVSSTWMSLDYQEQMTTWYNANPDAEFAQKNMGGIDQDGTRTAGLAAFRLAWPTVTLVWFGLVKTKPVH